MLMAVIMTTKRPWIIKRNMSEVKAYLAIYLGQLIMMGIINWPINRIHSTNGKIIFKKGNTLTKVILFQTSMVCLLDH